MKTLSHVMILLALGTVISLSGISSCKKQQLPAANEYQSSPFALDQDQNFHAGHAPIPGTLLLLGSGVAGMALLGWRRRTKR